ncbi:MAG TPA: hypothetical protein VH142_22980 [Polyangiaceae bacterium]|nr:hypothetical protein [Polyangiaceae bacterium]
MLFAAWGNEAALLVRVATLPVLGALSRITVVVALACVAGGSAGLVVYGAEIAFGSSHATSSEVPPGFLRARSPDGTWGTIPEANARAAFAQGYQVESTEEATLKRDRTRDAEFLEKATVVALGVALLTFAQGLRKKASAGER